MTKKYKVLGQVLPEEEIETTLYQVPLEKESVVSTIIICNISSETESYRISVTPTGDSQGDKNYIAYDVAISGNDSTALTLGITLDSQDIISVYSSNNTLSFSAFGTEISD